jgi:hypothetical protein
MMVWDENEEALQLFPNGKYAIGLAQVSGMGAPAERSGGAAPFVHTATVGVERRAERRLVARPNAAASVSQRASA